MTAVVIVQVVSTDVAIRIRLAKVTAQVVTTRVTAARKVTTARKATAARRMEIARRMNAREIATLRNARHVTRKTARRVKVVKRKEMAAERRVMVVERRKETVSAVVINNKWQR
jgi:hypothetical protein